MGRKYSLPFKRTDPSILLRSSQYIISIQKVKCPYNSLVWKESSLLFVGGFIVGFTASFSARKNLTIAASKTEVPVGLRAQS